MQLVTRESGPYRLTLKLLALLVPTVVVTLTFSKPNLAFAGTLHLMRVLLQETYLEHFVTPNFTKLVPRLAPKPVPVMVTVTPRLLDAVSYTHLRAHETRHD